MDSIEQAQEGSRKNERDEVSFSDDDEAVHSVRFKRKKTNTHGEGANATTGGVTVSSASGRGSGLYLDTIQRFMLDFDFEKVCSVSLSNLNVYACLVCGKYFQGKRQKKSGRLSACLSTQLGIMSLTRRHAYFLHRTRTLLPCVLSQSS